MARMTSGRRPAELVLLGPLGGRLCHSNFRTKVRWPELAGELGWPGLRFHDLRATAIVLWIRAEVPLTTVRALAGHASLATTDRTRGSLETTPQGRRRKSIRTYLVHAAARR